MKIAGKSLEIYIAITSRWPPPARYLRDLSNVTAQLKAQISSRNQFVGQILATSGKDKDLETYSHCWAFASQWSPSSRWIMGRVMLRSETSLYAILNRD